MSSEYVELHCHSNYSFQEGASSISELLVRAQELKYSALALTDHDNLCGAMEFSRTANSLGVRPLTGAEVTMQDGSHLTFLAETRKGYSNLCNLITFSRVKGNRLSPGLDPRFLEDHSRGLILMTGCPRGGVPGAAAAGRADEAEAELRGYLDLFGTENVFVELQQNLSYNDTRRNERLVGLARGLGVGVVATNNVHYHVPERHRLQDALVAIRHNKTLEETHRERRPNAHFYLKSPRQMAALFRGIPEAIDNSARIAERCSFNLKDDLGYQFPDYPVPDGHTPHTYLEELCYEAALRRYRSITSRVRERLKEEFRLIRKHNLAGFFLIYHEIILMAHEVMIDLGLSDPEIPLEERPPGRGRGSSVAMLVGYLIGLSHVDPLTYNLSLERFLNDDMGAAPDIDLDFPRNIREELIKRVHRKWGWDRALLTGMLSTYKMKRCIRDLGKALGLPAEDVDKLAKRVDTRHAQGLGSEMSVLPDFRDKVDSPVWGHLIDLASQLAGFPKYLAQHPGGMVIGSSPLIDIVPAQPGAIEDRYICHWDKDSIDDAGFVKIDFLALGALSQMQDALQLIEERTGNYIDLSRIDFEDEDVYASLHRADTIGIFQVESAAQMQTITRIKPRNLVEMAYEVAAVRPGVGANNGVSMFIDRHTHKAPWDFDHPLEERALGRTLGIILFQDQVNQLAMDVAGFTPREADQLRRAFGKRNAEQLLAAYWEKFRDGAGKKGVDEETAQRIFKKFNGYYMFPESHAFAFGVTAFQMAWVKLYYPLEFYVAIFNQQPMGFYNPETLKEDARRHGVIVLNPDINRSNAECIAEGGSLRLGVRYVSDIGPAAAQAILEARNNGGSFASVADFMERSGLQRAEVENLAEAGTFDSLNPDRRAIRWEIGLRYRPVNEQIALTLPVQQDMVSLPQLTLWESMDGEYRAMGVHPSSHVMAHMRAGLGSDVISSRDVQEMPDGAQVMVAGLVIRRQRPQGKAVFVTLEDEYGHTPLILWPKTYEKYRQALKEPFVVVTGDVTRRDGTTNILVTQVRPLRGLGVSPKAKDWK
ncbi:MAG: DNA polymerase III subunit alpha [Chloroflexi bacterium]|nr:DNA polymerase III subunit alpha [Chloroflexota bacterium]